MAKKEKEQKIEGAAEMTVAEARALRAALHKPKAPELTEEQKREEFRKFWAQQKSKYGKSKDLEEILWLHLKAVKKASPEQFEEGVAHFGLKKVR
jgi:hypothetical protein